MAFLVTGGLWVAHHQLLDPLETHGRRLPRVNLLLLLTVSLLPYWVNVMATYPNNSAAAGLFVLWLGVAQSPSCWCACLSDGSWPLGPPSMSSSCPR